MKTNIRKVAVAGMMTAIAVALSGFSIPIGASRCFPIQHMMNVLAAVFLGPGSSVGMAFATSLIRNLTGTGSLLAFPGSMAGALLCGLIYKKTGKLFLTYGGEMIGTGIIGGILCYPVAAFLMGKQVAVLFYVAPFLISTVCGTAMAAVLVGCLMSTGAFSYLNRLLAEGE